MVETVLLALIFAKVRKCKISLLFKDWAIYPALLCVIFYIFFEIKIFQGDYSFVKYASIFKAVTLCMFIIPMVKYKQYKSGFIGAISIFIGSTLNNIVMAANGGKMPVFPTLSYFTGYIKEDTFFKANDFHILGSESTKLKFLSDIIDIGYSIMSIGDLFVRFFAFIVVFVSIKYANDNFL